MKAETNSSLTQPTTKQSRFRVWWNLLRPHTLTASFVPVLIGTMYALQIVGSMKINLPLFFIMLISCMLIQTATNLFNEYFDFKRGLDDEKSVGIGGAIVREGFKPNTVLNLAYGCIAAALVLGVIICMQTSWWLALVGIISILVGYLYTGGPIPIAYTPFGELTSGLFMGVVIIGISFFIQTGVVTNDLIMISIPSSLLIGSILLANNIRDLDGDKENGRRTLAILVGRKNATAVLGAFFGIAYVWSVFLMLSGIVTPWILVVFLSLPQAISAVRGFVGKSQPAEMMPAMIATAKLNTIFGFLFSVGLLFGYIF
ncbi:1,4-dihydroxy-2-naphthoate polyprenyltransferase [Ectobacillus polymachus]|uniref:1,4-dihydroxy-2-naphthoate polyprenyltransferase n=1 Tax=Ectobacillus polymachus TaxID=1508806 RepID=UPI003A8C715B